MPDPTEPLAFNYDQAFSRNLGWVSALEQQQLRGKRVAIGGAGGVGGVHLLTLARLGVGAFTLADMDRFEPANFNRQVGAMMSTVGQEKVSVMAQMLRDINPDVNLRLFKDGITAANVDDFLQDADLYLDALDFFAFDARQAVFAACERRKIPAISVAPLGMGASLICFLPGHMGFEQYFGFGKATDAEKALRFLVGLAPKAVHMRYLVEPQRIDLAKRKGPSTCMSVQLCAGVAGVEALKILLGRGRVRAAPYTMTFDAYLGRLVVAWRPWGHRNPLTQFTLFWARRALRQRLRASADAVRDAA